LVTQSKDNPYCLEIHLADKSALPCEFHNLLSLCLLPGLELMYSILNMYIPMAEWETAVTRGMIHT